MDAKRRKDVEVECCYLNFVNTACFSACAQLVPLTTHVQHQHFCLLRLGGNGELLSVCFVCTVIICGRQCQARGQVSPRRPSAHLGGSAWPCLRFVGHRCSFRSEPSHSTSSFRPVQRSQFAQRFRRLHHHLCSPQRPRLEHVQRPAVQKI